MAEQLSSNQLRNMIIKSRIFAHECRNNYFTPVSNSFIRQSIIGLSKNLDMPLKMENDYVW